MFIHDFDSAERTKGNLLNKNQAVEIQMYACLTFQKRILKCSCGGWTPQFVLPAAIENHMLSVFIQLNLGSFILHTKKTELTIA